MDSVIVISLLYILYRKVAGSIPDYVIGIFYLHNPSGLTKTLGSSTSIDRVLGIFHGGKGGRCVALLALPSSCADCLEI
jgi:hypothetical protein